MITTKLKKLNDLLLELNSVAVGFSGGVDSTFLAAAAHRVLGDKAIAVTAYSSSLPEREKQEAVDLAAHIGIKHELIYNSELDIPEFIKNDRDRCYYCKKERFGALVEWAVQHGYLWVLEGSNSDDVNDFRPGMRAVSELPKVRSILLEAGFTKNDIRSLSQTWGLPTWNKPSAACLASRVSYGHPITEECLKQIEQAEAVIKKYCHGQVRVRHHGNLARIEVTPEQIPLLVSSSIAPDIITSLKKLGFTFVTLDLVGYRMGSMNEMLEL